MQWRFWAGANHYRAAPEAIAPEVCFAGRSNVGKSTLINTLTQQKNLARASNSPGRTQQLNFFIADRAQTPTLVDLPGYGFAKAPVKAKTLWQQVTLDYLGSRAALTLLCLLIDSRRGLGPLDREFLRLPAVQGVSVVVVLTKADKLSRAQQETICAQVRDEICSFVSVYPEPICTSNKSAAGIRALWTFIRQRLNKPTCNG